MNSTDAVPPECRAMKLLTECDRIVVRRMWNTGVFSLRPAPSQSPEELELRKLRTPHNCRGIEIRKAQ